MFRDLIECIWPRFNSEPPIYNNFLDENTSISEVDSEISIKFATLMYEKQRERISTIESKSSIYLGFFGAVVAILAFALKDILFQKEHSITYDIALIFGGILIIYIIQVMRYSIKALERRAYHSIDESDFLLDDKRELVIRVINKTKKNYDIINEKVDDMTMAHEFTKRILWVILIAAIVLVAIPIFRHMPLSLDIEPSDFTLHLSLRWSDYLLALIVIALIATQCQLREIKRKLK